MSNIVGQDHPALRQIAKPLGTTAIKSAATKDLFQKMSQALAEQADGVALAAPQVGVSKRIFIVSGRAIGTDQDLIFINPRLVKTSKKKLEQDEGCLSLRWLYGVTSRASKASVEAYDEKGKKFIRHGSGLIAQIFQHEIDHLDGILFIDHAKNIKEIKPDDKN